MQEIATALARATDKQIETHFLSEDDAIAAGYRPAFVSMHQWQVVEGYKVDLQRTANLRVPLEGFASWAQRKRDLLEIQCLMTAGRFSKPN